jgi:hypothetical protein
MKRRIPTSRELENFANDIDDAKTAVEELQDEKPTTDRDDVCRKLKEVHTSLEDASDCVDELEERKRRKGRSGRVENVS